LTFLFNIIIVENIFFLWKLNFFLQGLLINRKTKRTVFSNLKYVFTVTSDQSRQGKFIYIAHFIHNGNSKCFT